MKNNQTGELQEVRWDRLLRIKTAGRDDSSADQYRYPYEPTPYSVLERLAGSGRIRKGNILLDYGYGKGRVGLFLSCQTRCRSIGVEYDPRIYEKALENQSSCVSSGRSSFVLANAEHYAVPVSVDRVYFFNPFSLELLQKVMARILDSYYEHPRSILLFFLLSFRQLPLISDLYSRDGVSRRNSMRRPVSRKRSPGDHHDL